MDDKKFDREVFKTALCWTMGIIMFLVIFIYDAKRVDLTLELEKKVETIERRIRKEEKELNYIDILRTQMSQLKPQR